MFTSFIISFLRKPSCSFVQIVTWYPLCDNPSARYCTTIGTPLMLGKFLRHFRFCDEEDSGLSDEEQERKGPKNRPKHTRKRIHQAKKNFLEKFKTASKRYI